MIWLLSFIMVATVINGLLLSDIKDILKDIKRNKNEK